MKQRKTQVKSQFQSTLYIMLLSANSVIDINKFSNDDASDTEKNLYAKFQQKQQQVFDTISRQADRR